MFCSSEVTPFAKTGGLADVAGSLPLMLGRLGADVLITMPRYRGITDTEKQISERVKIKFVTHEGYFNRSSLYGTGDGDYPDNLERFTHFCYESLEIARREGFKPDVVHVHDWHAALIPVLLKTKYSQDPFFGGTCSLLTIHNLAYQGHFEAGEYSKLGLDRSLFSVDGFEFYGKINLLKAGLLYADWLNTVSSAYAAEIQTQQFGFGLEEILRQRRARLKGILNGIDYDLWDSAKDPGLAATFSAERMDGKAVCKAELQKKCGLTVDSRVPVFAVVTRLAEQKGLDLLAHVADDFLSRSVQLVLVGDGDAVYQNMFRSIGARHPNNTKIFLGFNATQAHGVYAGADFFLMPSLFEPCGLGQIISMRYGTVPIVRKTGGLSDTVYDVDASAGKSANGLVFEKAEAADFLRAIDRGLALYHDKKRFDEIRRTGMNCDFSWERSAQEYLRLYETMRKSS